MASSCSLGTEMMTRMPVLASAASIAGSASYRRTWRMFCERSSVVICDGAGTDDMAVPMFTPMYAPSSP
uniref:Uncharacterized protein n=1 Tax=Arundo donax TaxID=35708 RepID=A0A0A9E968_ARUDO